jgi:hypothetical protein
MALEPFTDHARKQLHVDMDPFDNPPLSPPFISPRSSSPTAPNSPDCFRVLRRANSEPSALGESGFGPFDSPVPGMAAVSRHKSDPSLQESNPFKRKVLGRNSSNSDLAAPETLFMQRYRSLPLNEPIPRDFFKQYGKSIRAERESLMAQRGQL